MFETDPRHLTWNGLPSLMNGRVRMSAVLVNAQFVFLSENNLGTRRITNKAVTALSLALPGR